MKIDLKLPPQTFVIISATLQPIYKSKPLTRKEKSTLSIALDIVSKIGDLTPKAGKISLSGRKIPVERRSY